MEDKILTGKVFRIMRVQVALERACRMCLQMQLSGMGLNINMNTTFAPLVADLKQTINMRRVWMALATEDISDQHKRTTLGPFWLLLNYLMFVAVFIVVFGRGDGSGQFAAYLAVGLLVWFFISEAIMLGTSLFEREAGFIKGTPMPLAVYVMRMTIQSLIRSGYASIGCALIFLVAQPELHLTAIMAIPGIIIVIAMIPAVVTISAMGGAFFPDLKFVVQNLIRIGMFLTPIFWGMEAIEITGLRGLLYHWNPFTYLLQIVRDPIVFGSVPIFALSFCAISTLAMYALALFLLAKFRKTIALVV